jgi:hypothetical protein
MMSDIARLTAENAALRAALEELKSDCQCTIDLYERNGPTWTIASYVVESNEEKIAKITAVLRAVAEAQGEPNGRD